MTKHIDTASERAELAALEGHTPGPWRQGKNNPDRVSNGGEYISNCNPTHQSHPRTENNARLIAAAPDLLALTDRLLDALDAERARAEKAERDQSLAQLAAAYEVAASVCSAEAEKRAKQAAERGHGEMQINRWIAGKVQAAVLADKIRALTPADAEAALQRAVDAAWNDAIEAAARVQDIAHQEGANAAGQHHAILALKRPEASHE